MAKKLNPIEQHLFDTIDYLNGIGLEVFLIGSTLLQITRNKSFKERHQFDREINVGCKFEDLTQEMINKIRKDFNKVETRDGYILFGNQKEVFWEGEGSYFALLGKFRKVGDFVYEDMGQGHILKWPAWHLEYIPEIKYKDRKLKVPYKRIKWLEYYFGNGWKQEDLSWHWSMAGNLVTESDEFNRIGG